MSSYQAPRGVPDILPPESELLSRVQEAARTIFDRYGYRRIELPAFEHTDLFARGIGASSDIVRKEMYTFTDRGDRSLTLRPEGTAPVVRAFVEHRLDGSMPLPVRLYYDGPMWRYERPQKGRQRQFFQIGMEAIGSQAPMVDAEIIEMADAFYRALGLSPELLLNSMGCPADRARYGPHLKASLADRRSELCSDCLERLDTNPLRVFDCKVEACQTILGEVAPITDFLCDDCRAHHHGIVALLDAAGVAHTPDPRLVRGFDYYTRTVFEFDLSDLGARSAIGGGGRYDGLVAELGGPDLPGVGMAVGVHPTMVALGELGHDAGWRPDVYVVWLGEDLATTAMRTAGSLRAAGLRVSVNEEARSMKAQLRSADRLRAARAVILGPDEVERGVATIRDLASGEQREATLDDLASTIQES